MKWQNNRQSRLYLMGAIILLVGLGSAVSVYLSAPIDNALDAESSAIYLLHFGFCGERVHLIVHELLLWFTGLWYGESLAYTIGCISIVLSYGFFHLGYLSYPHTEADSGTETPAKHGKDRS